MSITIQTEGRRTYLAGDTYPVRDQIRSAGAHWDADRKMWWVGDRARAEQIMQSLSPVADQRTQAASSANKTPRDGLDSIVAGRAEYKGKTYYLAGRTDRGQTYPDDRVSPVQTQDGTKYLLYFRDGSSQFWVARSKICVIKQYDRPQTIRELHEYAASRRSTTSSQPSGDPIALVRGGARHDSGRNRHAGYCERCGGNVPAGEGHLEYCVEDSGCPVHHDEGGYHLYCADGGACKARRTATLEAKKAKAAEIKEADAELMALIDLLPFVEAKTLPTWCTKQTTVAHWAKPVMIHTGAYPALYLSEPDSDGYRECIYHVPGYFACDQDYPAVQRSARVSPDTQRALTERIDRARKAKII